MFAFEVQYLSRRAYACNVQDRRKPEWPPHPARFFSALVAAVHEAGLGKAERQALVWLEEQDPPHISAGDGSNRAGVTSYVPVNDASYNPKDGNSFIPDGRKRQARFFPSFAPDSAVVYFIWPLANPTTHLLALSRIADCVTYLGTAASLVRVRVCEAPPEPTLVPDEEGNLSLRVVARGRLQELESLFELGQRPSVGRWAAYRTAHSKPKQQALEASVFGDCYIFRLVSKSGIDWPVEAALKLTDAVRRTLLEEKYAGANPPDLLTGHGRHPHCAYVALPFVGHQHADGHLLGFAVVLPRKIELEDRRAVLRVLKKFRDEPRLEIPEVGEWEAVFIVGDPPRSTLDSQTWSRPARVWRSATPVLFDLFPKQKLGLTAQDIIAASCQHIGLPPPVEISIARYSPLTGVEPADKFLLRRRQEDGGRYAAHLTLTFDRPVRGPVLLGAGRYFGLGLMRPMANDINRRVSDESDA